jgi:hypothetical protein
VLIAKPANEDLVPQVKIKRNWGIILTCKTASAYIPSALKKWSCIAPEKLTLARHELQEVVILLCKFITQIALILTSKTDHIFNTFGINQFSINECFYFSLCDNSIIDKYPAMMA